MNRQTLSELSSMVRSMAGDSGETVQEREIKLWLKDAAKRAAGEYGGLPETWSTTTTASTGTYFIPDDVVRIVHVSYDDYIMKPITWEQLSRISSDGQSLTSEGISRHYVVEGYATRTRLTLYPIPEDAVTLKIHYLKMPTLGIREYSGTVTAYAVEGDSALKDTNLATAFGVPDQGSTTSPYLNGCQVYIKTTTDGNAPQGQYTYVSNYAAAATLLALSPAESATINEDDTWELQDILEIPQEWVSVATNYAVSMCYWRSPRQEDIAKAQSFRQYYESDLARMRQRMVTRVDTPDTHKYPQRDELG